MKQELALEAQAAYLLVHVNILKLSLGSRETVHVLMNIFKGVKDYCYLTSLY